MLKFSHKADLTQFLKHASQRKLILIVSCPKRIILSPLQLISMTNNFRDNRIKRLGTRHSV